jgi:hypothetical protein
MIKSPLTFTSLPHILSEERLPVHWRTIGRGVLYFLNLWESLQRVVGTQSCCLQFQVYLGRLLPSAGGRLALCLCQFCSLEHQTTIVYWADKQSVETFCLVLSWFANDHSDDRSTSASLIESTSGTFGCSVLSVLGTSGALSMLDKDSVLSIISNKRRNPRIPWLSPQQS